MLIKKCLVILVFWKMDTLIMECVTTTNMSVLVNGIRRKPIKPERGIKQGDLISSYIFIICWTIYSFYDKCYLVLVLELLKMALQSRV